MISTQIKNDITLRLVKKCRQGYPPLYLLDGHNTAGVSGAPAWAYLLTSITPEPTVTRGYWDRL